MNIDYYSKPLVVRTTNVGPVPSPKRPNNHLAPEPFMILESFSSPSQFMKNDRFYLPVQSQGVNYANMVQNVNSNLAPVPIDRFRTTSISTENSTPNRYLAPKKAQTIETIYSPPASSVTIQNQYLAAVHTNKFENPQMDHGETSNQKLNNRYLAPKQAQNFERNQHIGSATRVSHLELPLAPTKQIENSYFPPAAAPTNVVPHHLYLSTAPTQQVDDSYFMPSETKQSDDLYLAPAPRKPVDNYYQASAATKTIQPSHLELATPALKTLETSFRTSESSTEVVGNSHQSFAPTKKVNNTYLAPTKTDNSHLITNTDKNAQLIPTSTKSTVEKFNLVNKSHPVDQINFHEPTFESQKSYLPPVQSKINHKSQTRVLNVNKTFAPSIRIIKRIRTTTVPTIENSHYLPPATIKKSQRTRTTPAPIAKNFYLTPEPTRRDQTYRTTPIPITTEKVDDDVSYLPPAPPTRQIQRSRTTPAPATTKILDDSSYLPPAPIVKSPSTTATPIIDNSYLPSSTLTKTVKIHLAPAPEEKKPILNSYMEPAPKDAFENFSIETSPEKTVRDAHLIPDQIKFQQIFYNPPVPLKNIEKSHLAPTPRKTIENSYLEPAPINSYLGTFSTKIEKTPHLISTMTKEDSYFSPVTTASVKKFYSTTPRSELKVETSYLEAVYNDQNSYVPPVDAKKVSSSYVEPAPTKAVEKFHLAPAPSKQIDNFHHASAPTETAIEHSYLAPAPTKTVENFHLAPEKTFIRPTNLSPIEINSEISSFQDVNNEAKNSSQEHISHLVSETLQNNIGVDGYEYGYALSDGQNKKEEGQLINSGTESETIIVKGSYSWFDPSTNKRYTVNYVADENGFHAEGEHIPRV